VYVATLVAPTTRNLKWVPPTNRPPGHKQRAISLTARAGSGIQCTVVEADAQVKLAVVEGHLLDTALDELDTVVADDPYKMLKSAAGQEHYGPEEKRHSDE
jgi:hypothetical protein